MLDFIFKVVNFLIAWSLTVLVETKKIQMGRPSLYIKMMHAIFLYFMYSTRAGQKALQQSYKPEPP
jgi:hypothetical protein